MAKLTRRGLIKRATLGVGAAGVVAAAAVAGAHFAPATNNTGASDTKQSVSTDPIVVWIGNPTNGTIVMMRGESQVVVNNPAFVQHVLSL